MHNGSPRKPLLIKNYLNIYPIVFYFARQQSCQRCLIFNHFPCETCIHFRHCLASVRNCNVREVAEHHYMDL